MSHLKPTKLLVVVDEIDTTDEQLASGLWVKRSQPSKLCRGTVKAIGPGNMADIRAGDIVHWDRKYGRPSDYGVILDYDMLEAVEDPK